MRASRGIVVAVMVAAVLGVVAATAGGTNTPPGGGHTPVTICHKPGTPAQHTRTVDDDSVELTGHLGHGDTMGACTDPPEGCPPGTVEHDDDCVPVEPPVETTPPVTPPSIHGCVFVGADKDGGHDKYGGTNDDCAPRPDPPATTTLSPPVVVVPPAVAVTPPAATTPPVTTHKPSKGKPAAKPRAANPVMIVKVTKKKHGVVVIKTSDGNVHTGIMGSG